MWTLAAGGFADYTVVAAALIIIGVTSAFGWRDIKHLRLRRIRAIAGVSFSESIRRRVLWVIPLAIVAVMAVTQFTRPLDAQDAIRQTTKYCVFASGLIVVVATIILASTNLPKEIENRVIFTIVTKPTTRLEIVAGKVLGFSLISLLILLIMGIFSAVYCYTRTWGLEKSIRSVLADDPSLSKIERARLSGYLSSGLLDTKSVRTPNDMQIFGRPASADGTRWFDGGGLVNVLIPFAPTSEEKDAVLAAVEKGATPAMIFTLKVDARKILSDEEKNELEHGDVPREGGVGLGPFLQDAPLPRIVLNLFAQSDSRKLAGDVVDNLKVEANRDRDWKPGGNRVFFAPFTSVAALNEVLEAGPFYAEVVGITPSLLYGASSTPAELVALDASFNPVARIRSRADVAVQVAQPGTTATRRAAPGPHFSSRPGFSGLQLPGKSPDDPDAPIAVFNFSNAGGIEPVDNFVTLKTDLAIDKSGDLSADQASSLVMLSVHNHKTGFDSGSIPIELDAARLTDLRVPFAAVEGGDFDVTLRASTPGQVIGLKDIETGSPSVMVVVAHHSFLLNLSKSLLVLWMLSTLVIATAVFCSTFLSWPIAIVLTVLLLLGRWGVEQLGTSVSAGASRTWVSDLFGLKDASKNTAVVSSMEALTAVLRNVAPILPDVSRFPVLEDLDRGINMPQEKLLRALLELLIYGVPLLLLTYVVFRNKEVAP